MASSLLPMPLLCLAFLSLQAALGVELLNSVCLSTSSNFTSPTQYNSNVDALLKFLTSRSTLASTGFAMGSQGHAYGFINCRADATDEDCKSCAHQSVKAARDICPGSQGAIAWYDICTLKYSDSNFLGSIDTDNQFSMSNPVSVSGDPTKFNARVKDLLTKLGKKAVTDPKLFAKGKALADPNTTVYGLVECSRDLSSKDCGRCLDVVVSGIDSCCSGSKGGRVIAASCMFRYEVYPF